MGNMHGLTSMRNQSMGLLVLWKSFTIADILNARVSNDLGPIFIAHAESVEAI